MAFAHLEQLWHNLSEQSVTQVVLAVPGFYDRAQLSLLLGMAKESNIPVCGLIDTGLLTISQQPCLQDAMFLDISLHRISITQIKSDGMLRKIDTRTITETGLFTLWDRWANIVAKQFIQTSRYDPMHQAESEQTLFDLLPTWIESGDRTSPFELNLDTVKYSTQVSGEQLLSACSTVYPDIVKTIRALVPATQMASLFVSHRFQGFPGLQDSLQLIPNLEIDYLGNTTCIDAAEVHWDKLASTDGSVSHVTTLPVSGKKSAPKTLHQSPTHLLVGTRAYGIQNALRIESFSGNALKESANARCTLYPRGQEIFLESHDEAVRLNGEPLNSETILSPGDQISLDNNTATLITVN